MMKQRLEQWRSLAPWERRLLVQLIMLLPLVGLGVRLVGYRRTRTLLERLVRLSGSAHPVAPPSDLAGRIARLVAIAAHHGPYAATCLRQALALWWLLARRGIHSDLFFGVRRDQFGVQAHAWLELNGKALSQYGDNTPDYTPLSVVGPPERSVHP
jgi:hypothetical protein